MSNRHYGRGVRRNVATKATGAAVAEDKGRLVS
jgi:hypothetical protein